MSKNRVSNDLNYVANQSTATTKIKKNLSSFKSIFKFNIMNIRDDLKYELDKLLENVARNFYNIFNFFLATIYYKY